MSKKTSPQSRPGRRPRKIRAGGASAGSTAARRSGATRPAPETPAPTSAFGRVRRHLGVFLVPSVVIVLGIVAVALAGLLVTRTTLAALPATVAQLWLIINLVPVSGGGTVLGVLPLLPALGLVALVARRVHVAVRDRVSIADLLIIAVGVLVVPLALTLIAAAMMWDAGHVFDVGPPPLGHAVARTLLVHGLALVIGMGGRLWRALLRRYGAPEWLADAAATAARILVLWAGAGLLLVLVLLVAGWSRQAELLSVYNGVPGYLGTAVISLLYLPNAALAAATVMLGSEFHIGSASLSLYAIDLTALPPMPLFALIPGWAHQWSILLLIVTSLIVAYVLGSVRFNLVQTLATAVWTAVFVLVASYLITGQVGYLGVAGPMAWLTAGLAFAWTAGIGGAAALVGKLADRRAAAAESPATTAVEPEPEPVTEPELEEHPGEPEILEGEVVPEETEEPEEAEESETAVPEQPAEVTTEDTDDIEDIEEEPSDSADATESPGTPDSAEEGENDKDPGARD